MDDETIREVLTTALSLADYGTQQADTADSLRSALKSEHWALLVSDATEEPFGDAAHSLLHEVCERAGGTPVLVMTGSNELADWVGENLPVAGVLTSRSTWKTFLLA